MLTRNDLEQIRVVVRKEVKEEVVPVKNAIEAMDKKLDGVQTDVSDILTALDQRQTRIEGRVDRLEDEVGIAKPQ